MQPTLPSTRPIVVRASKAMSFTVEASNVESWPTIHNPGHKLTPAQRATKRARGKAARQARATTGGSNGY